MQVVLPQVIRTNRKMKMTWLDSKKLCKSRTEGREMGPNQYEKFRRKIINLQQDLEYFKADFLDRDSFKRFADNLCSETEGFNEICATGYFSETIREELQKIIRQHHRRLRLICQELDPNAKRDKKNLEVMRKLGKAGAEIKVNNRIHVRFLIAFNSGLEETRGFLIIGSFDFNMECLGRERYDAGIRTRNPDLVTSALILFDEIWNDPETIPFNEKYPDGLNRERTKDTDKD